MTEADPQLGINGLLPELIPDHFFNNPLFGKIIANWWTHPELENLRDAVAPTIGSLSPSDTLAFAKLVEDGYMDVDDSGCDHVTSIWQKRKELSVDEDGVVRAIIGHTSDVRRYFENPDYEASKVLDRINDQLLDEIFSAALNWRGESFADSVVQLIEGEEVRRWALANVGTTE